MPIISRSSRTAIAGRSNDERVYLGVNQQNGQLSFVHGIKGWDHRTQRSAQVVAVGAAANLAMGLTECCARHGRGKFFYFQKGFEGLGTLRHGWTEANAQLPTLVYVNFVWDEESKTEWFATPHWQRWMSLNARAGALNSKVMTMPIFLVADRDNYNNIEIFETFAHVVLTYNNSGYTYLGWFVDMTSSMDWSTKHGNPERKRWHGLKTDLAPYRVTSGRQLVANVHSMYRQGRAEAFFTFGELLQKAIIAHQEWVANGGYTVAQDPSFGNVAGEVERLRARLKATAGKGTRLQELEHKIADWTEVELDTLNAYIDAADHGVLEVSQFMAHDDGWGELDGGQRDIAIEIWSLRHAANERQLSANALQRGNQNTAAWAQGSAPATDQTTSGPRGRGRPRLSTHGPSDQPYTMRFNRGRTRRTSGAVGDSTEEDTESEEHSMQADDDNEDEEMAED